jgi:hypothetical protein
VKLNKNNKQHITLNLKPINTNIYGGIEFLKLAILTFKLPTKLT